MATNNKDQRLARADDSYKKISDTEVEITKTVIETIDINQIKQEITRVDDNIQKMTDYKNKLISILDQAKKVGVESQPVVNTK